MSDQITVSREKLNALLFQLSTRFPDPDYHGPARPWWLAARSTVDVSPQPEPELAAINPQPLPPVVEVGRVLAQGVVAHIAELHELAVVLPEETGAHVVKRAEEHLITFVDDFCGSVPLRLLIQKYLIRPWPWPRPIPIPQPGPDPEPKPWWDAAALRAVIGQELLRVASQIGDERLRGALVDGGNRLIDAALG